tara:strand:+ start:254 stop:436 length:183 start_codon:yes stop_codon:yes gene_type:complete
MATENQIQLVLRHLENLKSCNMCGAKPRYGDYECAHCGNDFEEELREWIEKLIDRIVDEE